MANGPIQVVLNSDYYIQDVIPQPGGGSTDFFADNDAEFTKLKSDLIEQLKDLNAAQQSNKYSKISYAKVVLKSEAIAKSHRPTQKIFTAKNECSIIGGGKVGEMYVQLFPNSANKIASGIELNAETITNWKLDKKTKKPKPNPTRWKSETGAIVNITPITAKDKIPFSFGEAMEWIHGKGKGSGYYVELFELPPQEQNWDILSDDRRNLYKSFKNGLEELPGIKVHLSHIPGLKKTIYVRLTNDIKQIIQLNTSLIRLSYSDYDEQNLDENLHNKLFDFFSEHPLVKRVTLSPVIQQISKPSFNIDGSHAISVPIPENIDNYPKVAIVDSGVSGVYSQWIIDSWDNIHVDMRDTCHGTFISGLLVNGQLLNSVTVCPELDGCQIIDLCMLPEDTQFSLYYPRGLEDFIMELEVAVIELKSRTGVRIFNFSMNIESPRLTSDYGILAKALDTIALQNDIIFVISSGNLRHNKRNEWDINSEQFNLDELNRNDDIAFSPAESCRNISVGALNPTDTGLASYSRKGPASQIGIKPDLVHYGGLGFKDVNFGFGLFSSTHDGCVNSSSGTSFSAPLVAKTMAVLENSIQGTVSRETLMALTIHNANIPAIFNKKVYKPILKDIIGYGIPNSATDMISGDDHSISLVFANRIKKGKILSFSFSWPQCLIDNNKCKGQVKLTLVSTPELDYTYGDELVRENVSVSLRQGNNLGQKRGQLKPLYELKDINENHAYEKQLIDQTFKWSPVKVFERTLTNGIENKGPWYLEVEYLARDGVSINQDGVPFTAILTISDPQNTAPVYEQMRQNLQAIGVLISDIQTAARITQRV